MPTNLTATIQQIDRLTKELAAHEAAAQRRSAELTGEIVAHRTILARSEAGLDLEKITLAETFLSVGDYSRAGDERNTPRQDAIKWFAGTLDTRGGYDDLRHAYFGTKSYDRWHGQAITCSYGMGPRHGSVIFRIGLSEEARKRDLTDDEREAAIYYLVNLEAIQRARVAA